MISFTRSTPVFLLDETSATGGTHSRSLSILEHDLHVGGHLVGAFLVGLVDDEDVGYPMMPAFIICTSSPIPGVRMRQTVSAIFTMSTSDCPTADRLYDDRVEAAGVEYERSLVRARG